MTLEKIPFASKKNARLDIIGNEQIYDLKRFEILYGDS